jgi:hypothetical protein
MSYITGGEDSQLLISNGAFSNIKHWSVFGWQPDADTGSIPVDVWSVPKLYTPPSSAQVMNVQSTSTDAGSLTSSGLISTASATQIIDSSANFIGDGVVVGDIVLNDTSMDHSVVVSVVSANVLDILPMHHSTTNEIGASYRVVTPAGAGATVLRIDGLDANLDEISEYVILNGAGIVPTLQQFARVNFCEIHGIFKSESNDGDIEIIGSVDGNAANVVPSQKGHSTNSFRTIPRGYRGFITNITASLYRSGVASDAMAQIALYENLWSGYGYPQGNWLRGIFGVSVAGEYEKSYNPYKVLEEGSDIWMRVEDVSDNNSVISVSYDVILIKK